MSNSTVDVHDPFSDAGNMQVASEHFSAPTEQAALPSNVCPNCLHTNRDGSIEYCEKCGYYARFGVVVGGGPVPEIEEKDFPIGSIGAMAAAFTVVGLFNIATLFYTPQGSPERTWWSLAQLTVGFVGFVIAHMYCFFRTLSTEDSVGMMDFVVSPTVGWFNSAKLLPKRLWAFVVAVAGITAILGSVIVLRGIPYNALFEGGPMIERRELASAIGQAVREAQAAQESSESLEEALMGFSDDGAEPPPSFLEEPERIYKDAVVVAYWTDPIGIVDKVLLAGAIDGKLQQLGMVSDLPQGARKKLTRVLPKYGTSRPFLANSSDPTETDETPTSDGGAKTDLDNSETGEGGESGSKGSGINWVQPKWLCRISFEETDEGIPINIQLHWVVRRMILTK